MHKNMDRFNKKAKAIVFDTLFLDLEALLFPGLYSLELQAGSGRQEPPQGHQD